MDSTYNNESSRASWMTPVDDAPNRETWLMEAVDRLARSTFPVFKRRAAEKAINPHAQGDLP